MSAYKVKASFLRPKPPKSKEEGSYSIHLSLPEAIKYINKTFGLTTEVTSLILINDTEDPN